MQKRGFTLAEVMVCCFILSVLTFVAYPSIVFLKEGIYFNRELFSFIENLQLAKINAIKSNSSVTVALKTDGYDIFFDNGKGGGKKGDGFWQPGETTIIRHVFPKEIRMKETTFTANRMIFRNGVYSKAGEVVLTNNKTRRGKIIVNTVGRIRTE